MITIWKLNGESWELIEESNEAILDSRLAELREDGSEYRAELRVESSSTILEA
jgi:hypothetical protein